MFQDSLTTEKNSTSQSRRLEPLPDWADLDRDIGHCWFVFTYGVGSMFCICFIFSSVLSIWYRHQLSKYQNHIALVSGTMLCSSSLGLFLIIDPHSRWRILPEIVTYFLAQLYKPSVILSFISVQNVLIHISSIQVKTNKFQSTPRIVVLCSIHLFTICSLEIVIYFYTDLNVIRIVPEAAFMALSSYSCVCYIYSGFKLTNYILDTKALDSASINKLNENSMELCKSYNKRELPYKWRGKQYADFLMESPSRLYNRMRRGQTVSTFILDLDSISSSSGSVFSAPVKRQDLIKCGVYNIVDDDQRSKVEVDESSRVCISSSLYQNESYDPCSVTVLKTENSTSSPNPETASGHSVIPNDSYSKTTSKSLDSKSEQDFQTGINYLDDTPDCHSHRFNKLEQSCTLYDGDEVPKIDDIYVDVHISDHPDDALLSCSNNHHCASISDDNAIYSTLDARPRALTNSAQFDINTDIGYLADGEVCDSPFKSGKNNGQMCSTYSICSACSVSAGAYYQLPKKPPNTCSSFSLLRVRQCIVLKKVVPVVYWVTFVMIVNIIFELYALFGVYGILGSGRTPEPWPWFLFQVLHRCVELVLVVMLQVAMVMLLGNRQYRRHRRRLKTQNSKT